MTVCGPTRHGFDCVLPAGHNRGRLDIPENHRAAAPPDAERAIVVLTCPVGHFLPWPTDLTPYPTTCTCAVKGQSCSQDLVDPGTRWVLQS